MKQVDQGRERRGASDSVCGRPDVSCMVISGGAGAELPINLVFTVRGRRRSTSW
jgi:hypothetical protein